jgi:ADP-ribosyl-[dinitrogen reductase] hydrolase
MNPTALQRCLIGGALGDSVGLPLEGIGAARIAKLRSSPLRQSLIARKGMVSDDTEHAIMTVLSLLQAGDDPDRFARKLAGRLPWWLASVPAGIGLATAKSIMRLMIGISPARSGVWSAGNGPLMRAPAIGVWFAGDKVLRDRFVDASTLMTHRDPRAIECARLIASAAACLARQGNETTTAEILNELDDEITGDEMRIRFPLLRQGLQEGDSVREFADRFTRKNGYVTGFAPDSTAVSLFAWLRHRNDFRAAVESVIFAGGDTDTHAFIVGSIAGIECEEDAFPEDWRQNLRDWPINMGTIHSIARGTARIYPCWPLSLVRNLAFLAIVLCHAFRRLLPPY